MSDEQVRNANIAVSLLDGHARNYRQHPPEQIKQLVASLQRFQQVRSIVVKKQPHCDRYTILAGHGLVEAARECYYPEVRCDIVPDSWDNLTCQAYLIADNNLSNLANDDESLLAELLSEQLNAGFDLASMGSDEEALRQMLSSLGDEVLEEDEEEEERTIPGLDAPDLPYKNQFAVAVMCASESEQQTIFEALTGQGYTCKVLVV
jgi:ParB-like chromosome segregation protein Spo0J